MKAQLISIFDDIFYQYPHDVYCTVPILHHVQQAKAKRREGAARRRRRREEEVWLLSMDADNRVVLNCGGIRHEVYKV